MKYVLILAFVLSRCQKRIEQSNDGTIQISRVEEFELKDGTRCVQSFYGLTCDFNCGVIK